jgi:uncharacterized protein (TIGR02266 family)
MNDVENSEKRSSTRIKVELRVYYGPHQSKLLTGFSVDLGAGGLFLSTTCPFDVDDIVKLKFNVPGEEGKVVACDARVAWINYEGNQLKPEYPVGAGLQFVDLATEDLTSIESYLEIEGVW